MRQRGREQPQRTIAGLVPVRVVEHLEVVQVRHRDGDGQLPVQQAGRALLDHATVHQPGQRIRGRRSVVLRMQVRARIDGLAVGDVLCAAVADRRAPSWLLDRAPTTLDRPVGDLHRLGEVAVTGVRQQQRGGPVGHALREGTVQDRHRLGLGLDHLECPVDRRVEPLALGLVAQLALAGLPRAVL